MINLLYVGPQLYDAVSFYRGWGPLTALQRQWPVLNVEERNEVNWAHLRKFDIVYIARPSVDAYVRIIEMCKLNGKKVWVDYDDDLFNVPRDNPAFKAYSQKDTRLCVEKSLRSADLVTVSTKALQGLYGNYNATHLVPNAYDKRFFWYRGDTVPAREKTILWRGSASHDNDLMEVASQIIEVGKAYPDWKWVFVGEPSGIVMNMMHEAKLKIEEIPVLDPAYYFRRIYDLRPFIQIVPLVDNVFNRAKSNIAWIEATHAGAICVASDLPEFNVPGCHTYNRGEFKNALEYTINKEEELNQIAWKWVNRTLLLDDVNQTRKRLIESLL